LPRDELADVVQGRLALSEALVHQLANRLGVQPTELLRQLLEEEAEAWTFYRTSARQPLYVWQRARASWERAGLSLRLASAVMGVKPSVVTHALLDPERRLVMSYDAAARLATALRIEDGARFFIANAQRALPPEQGVEEVQPLSHTAISELYLSAGGKRLVRDRSRGDDR
jgi:kynureninase